MSEVGGRDYPETVAKEDPKTFIQLLTRILPSEIKTETNAHRDQPAKDLSKWFTRSRNG